MDMENHLNVYIYAPIDARLRNCTEILKMDEKTARKMIREVDRSRELYHRRYCPEYSDPTTNNSLTSTAFTICTYTIRFDFASAIAEVIATCIPVSMAL